MISSRQSWLSAIAISLAVFSASAGCVADDARPETIDPHLAKVLHEAAGFMQRAAEFTVSLDVKVKAEGHGETLDLSSSYLLLAARPNLLAMRMTKGGSSIKIVSDGKQMYREIVKKYSVSDAPSSLDKIFNDPSMAMMLLDEGGFLKDLFSDHVYEQMMDGVTAVRDAGTERVDDRSCRHLHLTQREFDWNLWVEDGATPLVRKVTFESKPKRGNGDQSDAKISLLYRFYDWNLDPKFSDDQFAFKPSHESQKVDNLFGAGDEDEQPHHLLGKAAPDFELEQLGGGKTDLARHRNKKEVVILDFWATWCGPCRQALPTIAKVAKKYRDKGVAFYAIDLEESADDVAKVLAEEKLELPVILDRDGAVAKLYQAEAIPQTVLVGKDGKVQVVHVGLTGDLENRLSHELDDLLAGKDLAAAAQEALKEKRAKQAPTGLELAWSREGAWAGVAGAATQPAVYALEPRGRLVKLNEKGEEIKSTKIEDHATFIRTANLVGDDECELLTFSVWGHTVKAHRADGKPLWSYDEGAGVDDVWAADLNDDGLNEVIIGYNGGTGLHILDNTGKLLWKNTKIGNVWHVTAGRVDPDARPQIVTTSAAGKVHVFSAEGKHLRDLSPDFYAHMVRVWQKASDDKSPALVIAAGSGQPSETVAALDANGKTQWSLNLPASAVNAVACQSQPWLALTLENGSVRVIDVFAGKEISQVGGQGNRADVAWLPAKEGTPLMVVATGGQLHAYRVTVENP